MSQPPDIGEIARMLNARALEVCRAVFPGNAGHVEGNEFKIGDISGSPGRSLSVYLRGHKAGRWKDFGCEEHHGDALELVRFVMFAGNRAEARRWALQFLGLDGTSPKTLSETRYAQARHEQHCRNEDDEIDRTRRRALAHYLRAEPDVVGTLVDRYLRGRCIELAKFKRIPRSLRFHPGLKVKELERRGLIGAACYLPAMVAPVYSLDGKFLSLHRTWLAEQPDGTVRKAQLDAPKKTLGPFAGGCIRLARGKSGKPLNEAPDDDEIFVTEGIEDGLTLAEANPDWRVVACVSLGNMSALELPTNVARVTVMADNDKKAAPRRMLDRALDHLARRHKSVGVVHPPPQDKDLNGFIQRRERERAEARAARASSSTTTSDPATSSSTGDHGERETRSARQ